MAIGMGKVKWQRGIKAHGRKSIRTAFWLKIRGYSLTIWWRIKTHACQELEWAMRMWFAFWGMSHCIMHIYTMWRVSLVLCAFLNYPTRKTRPIGPYRLRSLSYCLEKHEVQMKLNEIVTPIHWVGISFVLVMYLPWTTHEMNWSLSQALQVWVSWPLLGKPEAPQVNVSNFLGTIYSLLCSGLIPGW